MSKKSVAGAISYVMLIMIFSRLLSLVANQVYLSFFGAREVQINIYSYAITVPNIVFNCFGTALATVIIPIYTGRMAKGETQAAKTFADNIITISTIFTVLIVFIGIGAAFVIPRYTGFATTPESYAYTTRALMIMMPVMLFYGLNYIFQGMLQSIGKFGWPAFVSVPSSLIVIAYVLLLGDVFGVNGLLIATFIGLAMQALILIPPLIASGYRYKPSVDFKNPDIIMAARMTLPVLLGVSAYQANMFYNVTMIANFDGMVTLLTYAQNITLYMVLAFVYSITAVIFPKLTASAAKGEMQEYKNTLSGITKAVFALLMPIAFGFIAMRFRLLELITKWGKITDGDINTAASFLLMYSIGILAIGIKEIYDRAFYALKNTVLPAVNGFVIMAINIGLSVFLIRYIGAFGIPLAYSVASLVGSAVLFFILRRKIGGLGGGIFLHFLKCAAASVIMFVVVVKLDGLCGMWLTGEKITERLLRLVIPCLTGVLTYAISGALLKIDYITKILRKLKLLAVKNGGEVDRL